MQKWKTRRLEKTGCFDKKGPETTGFRSLICICLPENRIFKNAHYIFFVNTQVQRLEEHENRALLRYEGMAISVGTDA
jgi:hypothetical protein